MYQSANSLGLDKVEFCTMDGQTIDFTDISTFDLLDITGLSIPSIDYVEERYRNGTRILDHRYETRQVQLFFNAKAKDRAGYWDLRTRLINLLRPNRTSFYQQDASFLKFTLANGQVRQLNVILASSPEFSFKQGSWDEWCIQEEIRFITVGEPFFYDPDVKCIIKTYEGTINDTIDIDYCGNVYSYPTISIEGRLTSLNIFNYSIKEEINIPQLPSSTTDLVIDLNNDFKSVTTFSGLVDYTGYASNLASLSCFTLEASPTALGGCNTLSILGVCPTGDGVKKLKICYYERYLGI